jgi:hypothetical protein
MGLEPEIGLEVLRDLTNQALERKLADEELSALLILADLTQSDSAGPVNRSIRIPGYMLLSENRCGGMLPETMGLLHTAGRRGGLPCSLRCELLTRSLRE